MNLTLSKDKSAAINRATWFSAGLNLFLACAQIVLGFFSASQALVADGFHTLSDLSADLILLVSVKLGNAKADADHPYGHKRYENVASMMLGGILMLLAVIIFYNGAHRLITDTAIVAPHPIALMAAVITMIAKEGLFRYLRHRAKQLDSSLLMANAWHARTDAADSLIVFVGVGASLLGYPVMDAVSAVVISVMILYIGGKIVFDAIQDLSDRGVDTTTCAEITRIVEETPEVLALNKLRTRKSGDLIWIDVDIAVAKDMTVYEGHRVAHEVINRLHAALPVLDANVHIEPFEA